MMPNEAWDLVANIYNNNRKRIKENQSSLARISIFSSRLHSSVMHILELEDNGVDLLKE